MKLQDVVVMWEMLGGDTGPSQRMVHVLGAPTVGGRRLPYEGEEVVADWWPNGTVEERTAALQKDGPFGVFWETPKGPLETAAALVCSSTKEERIAAWIQAALWETGRREWGATLAPRLRPVWNDVYGAVREVAGLDWHHRSVAFPDGHGRMTMLLEDWIGAHFEKPPASKDAKYARREMLERVVGYALMRRAIVLSAWTLVQVAAVHGGVSEARSTA